MGVFDRFKRAKQPTEMPREEEKKIEEWKSWNNNGINCTQLDYYDNSTYLPEFYDTTRLVLDQLPVEIAGQSIYTAKVSWYGEGDAMQQCKNGAFESPRAGMPEIVKIGIDAQQFQNNPEYRRVLMTKLLLRSRVQKYLQEGMEEHPKTPHGNYVGQVTWDENKQGFVKELTTRTGEIVHYSPEMMEKRQREKIQKASELSSQLEELKRQQGEIARKIESLNNGER